MEAWAVLADNDEVGGPEENIDRFGVLKSEGCWGGVVKAGSDSARRFEGRRETVREGNIEADVESSAVAGDGEFLADEVEGNDQVGSSALDD